MITSSVKTSIIDKDINPSVNPMVPVIKSTGTEKGAVKEYILRYLSAFGFHTLVPNKK